MSNPIRVGIIGATPDRGWALTAHVPSLKILPAFALTAVSTSRRESADEAARRFGARHAFTDPAALAACADVDLVVISVKVPEHDRLVRAALEAGKHVFCEWPLGRTTQEAEALRDLAKAKGVRTFVGLQARYAPVLRHVRALVAEGAIGDILSCTLTATSPIWGPVADRFQRYLLDDANGATMLTINAGHTLDGLCFCAGEFADLSATLAIRQPTAKDAETGETVAKTAPDQIAIAGRLQGGAIATLHFRGGVATGSGLQFEINGTEGDLLLATDTGLGLQNADLTLRGSRGRGKPLEPMTVPDRFFTLPQNAGPSRMRNVGELYAHIARCLQGGEAAETDFDLAVRRHYLLDAIRQSSGEGRRISLK
jgi:predicted dehydrogenase